MITDILKMILDIAINLGLIIAVLAVVYCIVWAAIFFPIVKLRKHKAKVDDLNREYNKIAVELTHYEKNKLEATEELKSIYWQIGQKQKEYEELNKKVLDTTAIEAPKAAKKTTKK